MFPLQIVAEQLSLRRPVGVTDHDHDYDYDMTMTMAWGQRLQETSRLQRAISYHILEIGQQPMCNSSP